MAEIQGRKTVTANQKNPRVANKVCEFLPYSGREAFKRLRTNALLALSDQNDKKCQIIGVTSAQPSEGKSIVSINFAYSIAELGKSVLLIDGDMRRPSVHGVVDIPLSPGLSDVLSGAENLSKTIVHYQSTTGEVGFNMIPSGVIPANPSELLNSDRFQRFMEVVSTAFDYVIIDLPPVGVVIDAVNVVRCTDGMIVVLRENHCPRYMLSDCVEQLRYAKANILGFVLNGCIEGAGKRYQYSQLRQYRQNN